MLSSGRAPSSTLFKLRVEQTLGQVQTGLAVVADHRTEMLRLHDPVDGDDRQPFGLQLKIAVITGWQATGNNQRITTPRAKQLQQFALAVRRIVGTGDQQLIAARPRTLLQQLGDPRVAGVFQIRQDKTQSAGMPAAQSRRLWVGRKAVQLDHRTYSLDGRGADALLFGLAVDDVARGGHGYSGQPRDITEFQLGISLLFRACREIFANPTR